MRPTNGYHGQVEGEEVTPGKEAREDMEAAHIDAAVQVAVWYSCDLPMVIMARLRERK